MVGIHGPSQDILKNRLIARNIHEFTPKYLFEVPFAWNRVKWDGAIGKQSWEFFQSDIRNSYESVNRLLVVRQSS